jgi:hypothetical protein
MYHVGGRTEIKTRFSFGNLKEINHLEDRDERVILKWMY